MAEPGKELTCFIAMPISTNQDHVKLYGGDQEHWDHVMETLFEKAIEQAGFRPIRPAADGANLIHGLIIQNLSNADLVLVDLSTHNPNVFFELGVRTSIDRPIALVRDEHTSLPFDVSGINAYRYDSNLLAWELERQQANLARHIEASYSSCDGHNPLWRKFGLTIKASEPDAEESPLEAKVDLIADHIAQMQGRLERGRSLVRDDQSRELEPDSHTDSLTTEGNRGTPAEMFITTLKAHFNHVGIPAQMIFMVSGPDVVDISFSGDVARKDVISIEALAKRYGTKLNIHG